MGAPQLLQFDYRGQSVTVALSHDLYMQIEDRVSFARLSNCFANIGNGQVDMPLSHVAYVISCCLRSAGMPGFSPDEVRNDVTTGAIKWGPMMMTLISGYYGATPKAATEERIAKKPPRSGTTSRRNSRRST